MKKISVEVSIPMYQWKFETISKKCNDALVKSFSMFRSNDEAVITIRTIEGLPDQRRQQGANHE
ncbi:MAG: hypothetical protein ACRYHA_07405 [Janthinobacterium lividum]